MDLPDHSNLLAQRTRGRLFATLKELRRSASTEELAGELGLHVNGVRRQLERMHEGGLLERRRTTHGRGRPRDEWSIASGANPSGGCPEAYADLAGWLTRSIPAGGGKLRQVEKTGREIGRELAPPATEDLSESFHQVLSALGFQPDIEVGGDGQLRCSLGNCPYRSAVRENPEVICTLHKGITQGLLDELDPAGRLTRFEPHDPDRAGCVVEVSGAERVKATKASG
jgi:predicted ArsR family transcriptional regulator